MGVSQDGSQKFRLLAAVYAITIKLYSLSIFTLCFSKRSLTSLSCPKHSILKCPSPVVGRFKDSVRGLERHHLANRRLATLYLPRAWSSMAETELSPRFAPFLGMVSRLLAILYSDNNRYQQGGIAFAVSLQTSYYSI